MPLVGLGTWQAARGVVGRAVADALDLGYVHIDCAAAYANECEVGESLAAAMGKGTVKRENLFVTSKLWVRSHPFIGSGVCSSSSSSSSSREYVYAGIALTTASLFLSVWCVRA